MMTYNHMSAKLTFLGADRNVTGSRTLLEIDGQRLLIDCGMTQERELRSRDWDKFPVPPSSINAVLLTHAHVDHCGLLPKFVREGFSGPIYCTPPTAELTEIMLLDAARLQEHDAEMKQKRHEKAGKRGEHPDIPLYTEDQVKAVPPLFKTVPYNRHIRINHDIEVSFHDAGHVLGSAMISVEFSGGNGRNTIIFSGDLGRWDRPILQDPTLFDYASYVLTESTYGDRKTPNPEEMFDGLVSIINTTIGKGGSVVVPSFALERSQEILYYLFRAYKLKKIPVIPVFVDSPMAVSVTDIFRKYSGYFDEEMQQLIKQSQSPFDFPGLHFVSSIEESKKLTASNTPSIIIAGSGMATGGRIKYHLVNHITRPESTILFVGYQAVGTLGRTIVDGSTRVRILGEYYPVKARVEMMHGFSSHADSEQITKWLYHLKTAPRKVFVNHGEDESSEFLADTIRKEKNWDVVVPQYLDEFNLD